MALIHVVHEVSAMTLVSNKSMQCLLSQQFLGHNIMVNFLLTRQKTVIF